VYRPLLNLAPAEMIALEKLPERDKDALTPIFPLRPWLTTKTLEKAFDRIEKAYGTRPAFLIPPSLPPALQQTGPSNEIRALLDPANGYDAWCQLFESGRGQTLTPGLQLTDAQQFDQQANRLLALGRGAIVTFTRSAFPFVGTIASRLGAMTGGGDGIVFLIDLGKQGRTYLIQVAELAPICGRILNACPNATISVCSSSFPDSFDALESQDIYERQLFHALQSQYGGTVVYSDRGSARAEKQGGGGVPFPRIDYPLQAEWRFYRTEVQTDWSVGYTGLATKLMGQQSVWDPNLRIWGTQMIEKTHLQQSGAIASPARSTAVRINLHLHRQLWFGNPDGLYDTDDEWVDF